MSFPERVLAQEVFVSKMTETLLFDVDGNQLSSVEILRNAKAMIESVVIELEDAMQSGYRFGSSSAGRLVVLVLKEASKFAQTPEESMVLKKRIIARLVDNGVAEHEINYLQQRAASMQS